MPANFVIIAIMLVAILFFLGLCFGSFVNALDWRVHKQQGKGQRAKGKDLSILKGRSMCPHCGHQLSVADLVPVFSWLLLGGRCRYCKKPIPDSPLVELAAGVIFALSYIYWPYNLEGGQLVLFVTWLSTSVGLLALAVYDLRWMLLPSKILYPVFFIAFAGQLVYFIGFEANKPHALVSWILSVLVASGIFLLLFLASQGKWIGYGDVRLGLITGTLLRSPAKSFLMIFLASALGALVALPLIAAGKQKLSSRVPFGPFLILATFICVLWGSSLINWYKGLFLP